MDLKKRGTGKTTRLLIRLLDDMLNDKDTEFFVVVIPHDRRMCEEIQDTVTDLLRALGIAASRVGCDVHYSHSWNGVHQFTRYIKVVDSYEWVIRREFGSRLPCSYRLYRDD